MRGKDERNVIQLFSQETRHRHIPSMRVNNIDSRQSLDLGQVQREGFQRSFEFLFGSLANFVPWLLAAHMQVALIAMLAAPAMNFHGNLARQLAAEIFHVNSGSAIDVRRVFPCEESYSQDCLLLVKLHHSSRPTVV